jgi:AcrR family transcriptional regulator
MREFGPISVKRRIKSFAVTAYRETILDAAEQLFVNVGYHDAKMSELVDVSGVSSARCT